MPILHCHMSHNPFLNTGTAGLCLSHPSFSSTTLQKNVQEKLDLGVGKIGVHSRNTFNNMSF